MGTVARNRGTAAVVMFGPLRLGEARPTRHDDDLCVHGLREYSGCRLAIREVGVLLPYDDQDGCGDRG